MGFSKTCSRIFSMQETPTFLWAREGITGCNMWPVGLCYMQREELWRNIKVCWAPPPSCFLLILLIIIIMFCSLVQITCVKWQTWKLIARNIKDCIMCGLTIVFQSLGESVNVWRFDLYVWHSVSYFINPFKLRISKNISGLYSIL